jgi:hypothetical protein
LGGVGHVDRALVETEPGRDLRERANKLPAGQFLVYLVLLYLAGDRHR